MVLAILTTDSRELLKDYGNEQPRFGTAPTALLQGLAAIPEIQVHLVTCAREKMQSPDRLAGNIFFHSLLVPKIGWMSTFYQGCVRAVRNKLDELQPDIVHGQGTEQECAICAIQSGRPNVITLHGIMSEMVRVTRAKVGSFYWLSSMLERFALRHCAGVFCNSRFTEGLVRPRCRKTWLVPNPVRTEFFTRPLTGLKKPLPTLLNVGSICAYKRQNELIDLAESLHAEGLQFNVHFVGQASRASAYGARFLDRVRNNPRLAYLGLRLDDDLIAAYDSASALVHVSAVETFGVVVAEALARNLKFFGLRNGGIVDVAETVDQAELFNEGDWDGLKRGLKNWMNSGFARPTLAATTMKERYEPLLVARRHWEIYREVLERKDVGKIDRP